MKDSKQTIDISFTSILRFFAVCFLIYFVFYTKDIIFNVFIAVLIALIIEPFVSALEKKKNIPRIFGASGVFFIAGVILSIIIYLVAPPLAKELTQLAINIPTYISFLSSLDFTTLTNYQDLAIAPSDIQEILISISNALKNATMFIVSGAISVVGGIMSIVLILVMSFYLVLEEGGIEKFIKALIPRTQTQDQAVRILRKIENKLGRWFMGQISLGVIVGLLSFIGLSLIGMPYAIALALLAGLFELIPYIGPILSAIPAIAIALTISPAMAIITTLLYFIIQQFENYLIVPKVMEKSVGLHPIIIIIAAILGGKLMGVTGMILAVPIVTIAFIIADDIITQGKDEH